MSDAELVIFANEAFYAAFAGADMAAMDAIWAEEEPVSVVHPGAPAMTGRTAVMESWRSILSGEASFDVECRAPVARLMGDVAMVLCYEKVGTHALVATNVFRRTPAGWRIVHHQSGPSPTLPEPETASARSTLN